MTVAKTPNVSIVVPIYNEVDAERTAVALHRAGGIGPTVSEERTHSTHQPPVLERVARERHHAEDATHCAGPRVSAARRAPHSGRARMGCQI